MESKEYIANAIRTESVPEYLHIHQVFFKDMIHNMVLMAELGDELKRKLFYGKDIDESAFEAKMCAMHSRFSRMINVMQVDGINNPSAAFAKEVNQDFIANMSPESQFGDISNVNIRLLHCALGCFTESGELLEAIEKQLMTGHLDKVNFGEEVGDIEWYQAIGFDESGVTEASCRVANVAKLKSRYADKFSNTDALNRDLEQERYDLATGLKSGGTLVGGLSPDQLN